MGAISLERSRRPSGYSVERVRNRGGTTAPGKRANWSSTPAYQIQRRARGSFIPSWGDERAQLLLDLALDRFGGAQDGAAVEEIEQAKGADARGITRSGAPCLS